MRESLGEAIDLLCNLGLTTQESRLYVALLQEGPATPYRVAKSAGIPAGKVYDVVQRLVARELITEVGGSESGYIAKDAETALREMEDRYGRSIAAAASSLKKLSTRRKHNVAWNVEGREEVLMCGQRIIRGATSRIAMAAPTALVAAWLSDTMSEVPEGVAVSILCAEPLENLPPRWNWRRLTPANSMRVLKNGAVMTADRNVAFFASTNAANDDYQGSWTENGAVAAMADDYVASLIFIEEVFDNQWIPWGDI